MVIIVISTRRVAVAGAVVVGPVAVAAVVAAVAPTLVGIVDLHYRASILATGSSAALYTAMAGYRNHIVCYAKMCY